jgi:hypothetical protein
MWRKIEVEPEQLDQTVAMGEPWALWMAWNSAGEW